MRILRTGIGHAGTTCRRGILLSVLVALVLAAGAGLDAFQSPQDDFKPATELGEQLPGAPFVFVAYAFCWLAVLAYLFIIWQRLSRVQRELAEVSAKVKRHA